MGSLSPLRFINNGVGDCSGGGSRHLSRLTSICHTPLSGILAFRQVVRRWCVKLLIARQPVNTRLAKRNVIARRFAKPTSRIVSGVGRGATATLFFRDFPTKRPSTPQWLACSTGLEAGHRVTTRLEQCSHRAETE